MIEKVIVGFGIIFMFYSVILSIRLYKNIKEDQIKNGWLKISSLIIFFLIAYIAYFILEFIPINKISEDFMLIEWILLFGSVFVILSLKIKLKLLKIQNALNEELTSANKELNNNSKYLKKNQELLIKKSKELQSKNIELEKTLEDFYTLRISALKDIDKKEYLKENKKIKKRINDLKKEQ